MKSYSLFAAAAMLAATALSFIFAVDPAMAMAGFETAPAFGSAAIGIAGAARFGLTAAERKMGRVMRGPDHDASKGARKTAAELATEVKTEFDGKVDKVKELAERALAEAEKGVKLTETEKGDIDTALADMNELKGKVGDLEQAVVRDSKGQKGLMSAGARFVDSEEFKNFASEIKPRGRAIVDVKDITSLTTDAAGSVGALVSPDRSPAPVMQPNRRMTIRALLAPGQTNSNSIEYERETGFTNNAAPVAEGASKPQSELQLADETASVRTIAHWMRASVQILQDAPGLRSMIDGRLRYGLDFVEELQLLNGSGVGQNLPGLVTNATAYAAPSGLVAAQQIDTIRYGMLQVTLAEYPANGIALNPIDWAVIETLKDGDGHYLIGNPQGAIGAQLWNLPVVPTQAMAEDKFLVGAFDLAAQIFDRQDATVEASTEDGNNFTENKVTIRAEKRLALAIYRTEALVYGDLGRVT